ncbi:MAG TPA: chromosomal replication initiator protein DnaA, partial [Armatimonadota bacterium]|nr:chromosomal replication initiator protein DnaA [Armatimonadota bacterium]
IGRAFGGKDHTTVLHSIQKIEKLIETDSKLSSTISEISSELTNGSES